MIVERLLTASAVVAVVAATVIVVAAPSKADDSAWGAIAYSPLDGASGISSQESNESDARRAAINDCANNGGSGCEIAVAVEQPNCASLVANESLYSWGVSPIPGKATKLAMADLGEPGSEVTSTCGFSTDTAAAPITSAAIPTVPAGPTHPHPHPTAPSPSPLPAPPVG